jgi:nucleoside-diphosphate-sugar epimerase
LPIFFDRLSQGKRCFVTEARRDFVFVRDLARTVVMAAIGTGTGTYHFSSGRDVAIRELYDAVVRAMQLNHYPEPDIRPLGPDDAPSILLDPSRTFRDFGQVEFTPLDEIVAETVAYYRQHGVQGGYTHLRSEQKP